MDAVGIYEILQLTIVSILWSTAPILAGALAVGLGIAFFQALTQIQEMTLTFIPKIVAIFALLILVLPLMYETLTQLSDRMFDLIANGGV